MDLPKLPQSGTALALADAMAAAETHRAVLLGQLQPDVLDSVLTHLRGSAGELTVVDDAWDAVALPYAYDTCAWLLCDVTDYHTTYSQLYAVRAACRKQHTPTLVIIPNLGEAFAWRDHYKNLDAIPKPWRQPCEACEVDGQAMQRALAPGGPRNGVMTAIDDFMAEAGQEGTDFAWAHLRALDGLYVLFDANAAWARKLARRILDLRSRERKPGASEQAFRAYIADIIPRDDRTRRDKE